MIDELSLLDVEAASGRDERRAVTSYRESSLEDLGWIEGPGERKSVIGKDFYTQRDFNRHSEIWWRLVYLTALAGAIAGLLAWCMGD